MLAVFLLCAAFALSGATEGSADEPLEETTEWPKEEEEAEGNMSGYSVESCPAGWSSYGSRCFIFVNRPRTWIGGERYCLKFDANLASIHSAQEHRFVQDLVRRSTGEFTRTWIGGTDAVQPFLWIWSDGSRFNFHDWASDEPNNYDDSEFCLEMNHGAENLWNDWFCEKRIPFVCAKKMLSC